MARLRALAVFLFCPAVTVGEFYLPSFVASRSGVTRPERCGGLPMSPAARLTAELC